MNLSTIKQSLEQSNIFYAETTVQNKPAVVGYEKKFKWRWLATQLNTFVIAIDYGLECVTVGNIEGALTEGLEYAKMHYAGWPKGLQGGTAVVVIFLTTEADDLAIHYCRKSSTAKKWAAITVPIISISTTGAIHAFEHAPYWGAVYYPHLRRLIQRVLGA